MPKQVKPVHGDASIPNQMQAQVLAIPLSIYWGAGGWRKKASFFQLLAHLSATTPSHLHFKGQHPIRNHCGPQPLFTKTVQQLLAHLLCQIPFQTLVLTSQKYFYITHSFHTQDALFKFATAGLPWRKLIIYLWLPLYLASTYFCPCQKQFK